MEEEIKKDSATKRLVEFLKKTQKVPENTTIKDAWAQILGIDPKDEAAILNAAADIFKLYEESKNELNNLVGVKKSLYLQPYNSIWNALPKHSLHHKIGTFRATIGNGDWTALNFCVDTVSMQVPYREISKNMYAELRGKANVLQEEFLNSDMPDDLKDFIVEQIQSINRALSLYQINGSKGLERAIQQVLGALYLKSKSSPEIKTDERNKKHFLDLVKYIEALNELIKFSRNAAPIAAPLARNLIDIIS